MADDKLPEMHDDFAGWYRDVEIATDPDRLSRRWAGVVGLFDGMTVQDVEALIRLTFRSKQGPGSEALQRIRKPFRDADDSFQTHGNDREVEVLSAAALAVLLEQDGPVAVSAALAVSTASFGGVRRPAVSTDLVQLAESAIRRMSETMRRRPSVNLQLPNTLQKLDFGKSAETVRAAPNAEGFAQAFTLAAESVRTTITGIARNHASAVQAVHRFSMIQDEELQMLWWLIGGQSWELQMAFSDIPQDAKPLLLATELAGMTNYSPGPISIAALLSRAGVTGGEAIKISASINAADGAWLSKVIESGSYSPITQPLHFAIQRQRETDGGTAWIPGWVAVAGLESDPALSPIALAVQFYRERLLAKVSPE